MIFKLPCGAAWRISLEATAAASVWDCIVEAEVMIEIAGFMRRTGSISAEASRARLGKLYLAPSLFMLSKSHRVTNISTFVHVGC